MNQKRIMIVFVNGQRRSGKDTFIKYISTILETEYDFNTISLSFTDIAKSMVMTLDYKTLLVKDNQTRKLIVDMLNNQMIQNKTIQYFEDAIRTLIERDPKPIFAFIVGRDYKLSTSSISKIEKNLQKDGYLVSTTSVLIRNENSNEKSVNFDPQNFDPSLYEFVIDNNNDRRKLLINSKILADRLKILFYNQGNFSKRL